MHVENRYWSSYTCVYVQNGHCFADLVVILPWIQNIFPGIACIHKQIIVDMQHNKKASLFLTRLLETFFIRVLYVGLKMIS